jgi:ABC-type bacteriocin/lantibiotic exporter with double-glycine peptidase domain
MKRLLMFLLPVLCISRQSYAQAPTNALPANGSPKTENCGLYAAAFVLEWFDVPVDTLQLESELDVGTHWARATSLSLLKRKLEIKNLSVSAYKEANLDEVLADLDGKHVCLIHVTSTNTAKEGHFYLLIDSNGNKVLLVDAGKNFEWIPVDEFKRRFATIFSGYYLSISPPSASR